MLCLHGTYFYILLCVLNFFGCLVLPISSVCTLNTFYHLGLGIFVHSQQPNRKNRLRKLTCILRNLQTCEPITKYGNTKLGVNPSLLLEIIIENKGKVIKVKTLSDQSESMHLDASPSSVGPYKINDVCVCPCGINESKPGIHCMVRSRGRRARPPLSAAASERTPRPRRRPGRLGLCSPEKHPVASAQNIWNKSRGVSKHTSLRRDRDINARLLV